MVSFLINSPCVPWSGKDEAQISGKNFRESEIGAGTLPEFILFTPLNHSERDGVTPVKETEAKWIYP